MRRVAAEPDGWDCSSAAIWLTPEATRDLIKALSDVVQPFELPTETTGQLIVKPHEFTMGCI